MSTLVQREAVAFFWSLRRGAKTASALLLLWSQSGGLFASTTGRKASDDE